MQLSPFRLFLPYSGCPRGEADQTVKRDTDILAMAIKHNFSNNRTFKIIHLGPDAVTYDIPTAATAGNIKLLFGKILRLYG